MNNDVIRYYEGKELALEYEKCRPKYTQEMAEKIMKQVYLHRQPDSNNKLGKMLDVGCGGGQSIRIFSPYFHSSLGIDISVGQLAVADKLTKDKSIKYQLVADGKFPVEDESIDFILCACSLHWLDFVEFELECKRALKPNGVVAAFGYFITEVLEIKNGRYLDCGDEYKKIIFDFFKAINAHPRSYLVGERYVPIFQQLSSENKRWIRDVTLPSVTTFYSIRKYFSTIGEYYELMKTNPQIDPLDVFMKNLKNIWNLNETENEESINIKLTYTLDLIMFNK